MSYLIENWLIVVIFMAILYAVGYAVYGFTKMPNQKQVEIIKEWLLYACIEAEKEFKSGTGQVKLRYVYDLFLTRFPKIASVVSFDIFSQWVDAALDKMRMILTRNESVRKLVKGDGN